MQRYSAAVISSDTCTFLYCTPMQKTGIPAIPAEMTIFTKGVTIHLNY
jgi:hypothetical protein